MRGDGSPLRHCARFIPPVRMLLGPLASAASAKVHRSSIPLKFFLSLPGDVCEGSKVKQIPPLGARWFVCDGASDCVYVTKNSSCFKRHYKEAHHLTRPPDGVLPPPHPNPNREKAFRRVAASVAATLRDMRATMAAASAAGEAVTENDRPEVEHPTQPTAAVVSTLSGDVTEEEVLATAVAASRREHSGRPHKRRKTDAPRPSTPSAPSTTAPPPHNPESFPSLPMNPAGLDKQAASADAKPHSAAPKPRSGLGRLSFAAVAALGAAATDCSKDTGEWQTVSRKRKRDNSTPGKDDAARTEALSKRQQKRGNRENVAQRKRGGSVKFSKPGVDVASDEAASALARDPLQPRLETKEGTTAEGPDLSGTVAYFLIVDTNQLIDELDSLIKLRRDSSVTLVIPTAVLRELNGLKSNQGPDGKQTRVAAAAQLANYFCTPQYETENDLAKCGCVLGQLPHETVAAVESAEADDRIIACAKYWHTRLGGGAGIEGLDAALRKRGYTGPCLVSADVRVHLLSGDLNVRAKAWLEQGIWAATAPGFWRRLLAKRRAHAP